MHELSIANQLLEVAVEHAVAAGANRISAINLQIGSLSCVHPSAMELSFEMVTRETIVEGASLNIEWLPVIIYCSTCDQEMELPGIQDFRCPVCSEPSHDIRQGKEIDLVSIEVIDDQISQSELNDDETAYS